MASLVELVRAFRGLRALVIGDLMLDTYCEGSAARICSEGPVPVVRKTAEHALPGGAANAAANLRALGASVTVVGVIGADAPGETVRADLAQRGIECDHIVVERAARTLHKLRVLADGHYVVRLDDDAPLAQSRAVRAKALSHVKAAFASCDLVMVSDYGYGVVEQDIFTLLTTLRRARPVPLLVDSKRLGQFRHLGATVVTPNLIEARLLLDHFTHRQKARRSDGRETAPEQMATELIKRLDTRHVALTLAADGVQLATRDGLCRRIPAHPVANPHVAGAGDTFASALALALAAGGDLDTAARIAIDAAFIAVSKRWTAVAGQQELLQRVSLWDHADKPQARVPASVEGSRTALAETMAALARARARGKRIVFTNGVFDILHAGHVAFLRQARELGDVLVVGVNSDEGARRLKGRSRPINSERDRLALVHALDFVDYAVLFDEDTPASLIRALRPDLHVKGGDYATEPLPEMEAVREVGAQALILPLVGNHSTSSVIERIVALTSGYEVGGAP